MYPLSISTKCEYGSVSQNHYESVTTCDDNIPLGKAESVKHANMTSLYFPSDTRVLTIGILVLCIFIGEFSKDFLPTVISGTDNDISGPPYMLTFFLGEISSITCSPLFADIFSMRQIFGSLISATMIGYIICVFVPNSTSMTLGLFLRGFGYGGIAYYRYILVKITAIETIPLSLMILLYVNAS